MNEKISFFKALIGVCCGTQIFRSLRFQSWWRVIFHAVLLGLLAALLITLGELQRKKPLFRASRAVFEQTFGEKVLNIPAGFVPEKEPARARYISLPNKGRFWYFPSGRVEASLNELDQNDFLIFWAPRGFATALRKGENAWSVSTLRAEGEKAALSQAKTLSTDALKKLELNGKKGWGLDDDIKSFSVRELSAAFYSLMSLGLMLQNLMLTLVLPVLYTGIFVGMFRLTSGGKFPVHLTMKEFWKIGIYAGFPALLVASAFPALELPFLTFSTVYMIGLLAYWLYAATRLDRELFTLEKGDDGNGTI